MGKREGNRERLFRAFRSESVDRVPAGFWFHFLTGGEFNSAVGNPSLLEKNVAGHKKYIEAFHPDFVKIMSDGYFNYPRGQGKTYDSPESLAQIDVISTDDPWVTQQVELVKRVVALQEDTAYFYNVFSPLTNLIFLAGRDKVFHFLAENPEVTAKALDVIARGLIVLAGEIIKKGGADGIYLSVTNPDAGKIPHPAYRRYVSPSEIQVLEWAAAAGGQQILHICGFSGQHNDLRVFANYPVNAFNWASHLEKVDLAEGKKIFGGKAVLGGFDNVPGSLIHRGSKEDIEAFTAKLLAAAGTTGVILGADCTVPGDTDLAHLEWVRQSAAGQTAA
jgi:uroporphyrinogen decarboxylase